MATRSAPLVKRYPLAAFFGLAYAITWIFSTLATRNLLPFRLPAGIVGLSGVLYHFGPAFAALLVARVMGGWCSVRELLRPLGIWRIGWRWYLFIALYPLLLRASAVGIDWLLGGEPPALFSASAIGLPQGNPLVLFLPIFLSVFVLAGLAEEIGWRGFALPRLQERYSALTSSLILAALWAPWHYSPLNWGLAQTMLGWHILAVLAFTILLTWAYNHTRGSLLIAVLFHTCSNFADWIVPTMPALRGGDVRTFAIQVLLNLATAITIVVLYGPQRLAHTKAQESQEVHHVG